MVSQRRVQGIECAWRTTSEVESEHKIVALKRNINVDDVDEGRFGDGPTGVDVGEIAATIGVTLEPTLGSSSASAGSTAGSPHASAELVSLNKSRLALASSIITPPRFTRFSEARLRPFLPSRVEPLESEQSVEEDPEGEY